MDYTYAKVSILAMIVMVIIGYLGLPVLKKLKAKQEVREEGPQSHRVKSGTPTMGGVLILLALVIVLAFYGMDERSLWIFVLTLGHGLLGALDDGIKIFKKRNLGLSAKQKFFGQILLAIIFCFGVAHSVDDATTVLSIPHLGVAWDLSWGYYIWALLVIVSTTNAVNLTDGLDGLAAGTTAIASAAYVWLARGVMEPSIAIFAAALTGVCVGFLVFNYHPARVFMGDTGSLALGAALSGMALLTKTELLLVIVGGIFVAEALSVILQVASYKTRQKRIFRMSPLHHHFELGGWSETNVVHVFWFVGLLLAILGIVLQ